MLLFSQSVMSDSLQPHGLQRTRLLCPSLSPGVCSNSCPLSQWDLSTISSSVIPFSSCLQSFPASGSFPVSQLFALGGQSIRVSALVSIFPMNIQGRFPLGLTGLNSFLFQGLLRVFSSTTTPKHWFSALSCLYGSTLTSVHDYQKTIALTLQTFVGKVISLPFNMLSRFIILFLPRSTCLNSWLQVTIVSIKNIISETRESQI